MKILENIKVYRNTLVFISFTSLTIKVLEKKNAKNCHFCATRAEFTLNSNKLRFPIYFEDWKITKRIQILLIVRFRIIERQQRRKNIKMWWFNIIRTFFQKRILFILIFFFCVTNRRYNFIWCDDKKTTTKKRTKAIFTKTERTRKIFQIVFSTKTFKKNFKISNNREKKNL